MTLFAKVEERSQILSIANNTALTSSTFVELIC